MTYLFSILIISLFFLSILFIKSNNLKILHITDIHFDPYFKSGSSIYSFCHRHTNNSDELSSLYWGRECDSSEYLIKKTLDHISHQNYSISFIFLTGDNLRYF